MLRKVLATGLAIRAYMELPGAPSLEKGLEFARQADERTSEEPKSGTGSMGTA